MSNEKGCINHPRRKRKGSRASLKLSSLYRSLNLRYESTVMMR